MAKTSQQQPESQPQAAPVHARLRLPRVGSLVFTLVFTLLATLGFTTLVLLVSGVSPLAAYQVILFGAFRNPTTLADMTMLAAPLLLCASGLTLTFAAGLYNLGIEGQIVLGAVFAMIPLQLLPGLSPIVLWPLAFVSGMLGGAIWAALVALLRIYASVNEIFAGLGLNFIAGGIALYLVFGPWKRPGVASMSGTEPLPRELWLPTLEGLRLAPIAPVLALIELVLVWLLLTRSQWGLAVRATGLNPTSAQRMGVPTRRRLIEALAGCGALAGIAGTLQVLGVKHNLTPDISSGIGFLALLAVLLVRAHPLWVLPVVVAFASFTVGSVRLSLQFGMSGTPVDSSISDVLQGALVLFALVGWGIQERWNRSR